MATAGLTSGTTARFTAQRRHTIDECWLGTSLWSDGSVRQAIQVLVPEPVLISANIPEEIPTPTDVPVPEPYDVPVPEPIDIPPPEPHDVPPPELTVPEPDPQPRPIL